MWLTTLHPLLAALSLRSEPPLPPSFPKRFLSWHLRRGLLGEADNRPRDGVLHAGELTDYLYDGFVADHARINPADEQDRAQRLVVRRGAVTWDQVLWVYPRNPDLSLPAIPALPLTSAPPG